MRIHLLRDDTKYSTAGGLNELRVPPHSIAISLYTNLGTIRPDILSTSRGVHHLS